MSKYQTLADRFAAQAGEEWPTSFGELEAVLGFTLPKAARSGRSWWAADPEKPHSRAWAQHGWEVGDIDHSAERVVFRRAAADAAAVQPPAMKAAAEAAAAQVRVRNASGMIAAVAAGAALAAGAAALLARRLARRREPSDAV